MKELTPEAIKQLEAEAAKLLPFMPLIEMLEIEYGIEIDISEICVYPVKVR